MAYDEVLAERIRRVLCGDERLTEQEMFGGIAFMLGGNMACGVIKEDLMVRVGPNAHEEALAQPHVRPMDFAGKPMRGMIYVDEEGTASEADLERWVRAGASFAAALPTR